VPGNQDRNRSKRQRDTEDCQEIGTEAGVRDKEMPGDCQKSRTGAGVRDREMPGDCQKIRTEQV